MTRQYFVFTFSFSLIYMLVTFLALPIYVTLSGTFKLSALFILTLDTISDGRKARKIQSNISV